VAKARSTAPPRRPLEETDPLDIATPQRIYLALTSGRFSLDELEALAFAFQPFGLQWDNLSGDTLSTKARAFVEWCSERGLLRALCYAIQRERPDMQSYC
jgi:hypothetical protein